MDAAPAAGGALEEHGSLLLRQLEKMRQAEVLTDVVLLAEGVSFPCHRVVLSAFSPFFQAMFTCGLKETAGGAHVPLTDTPAASLQLLLHFMYQGRLHLSNHNIQQVAAAAFLLHVDAAFRLCESHMLAHMEPSNCVGVYQWARVLGATRLAEHALKYTCQHFTQVCNQEEILELDAQSLGELLALDELEVSEEQRVLEVVMCWAQRRSGDPQSEAEAAQLLRHVRLELVEPQFLHQARRRNPVLLLGTEGVGATDAALLTSGPLLTSVATRPALRYGMKATELLLCLGGVVQGGVPAHRGGLADLSFCFCPRRRKTFYVPSPLRASGGQGQLVGGVVTPQNQVLVAVQVQDRHRQQRLDFYRYDEGEQSRWVALCSAPHREMSALGLLGDALYLTGGQVRERHQQVVTASVLRWPLSAGGDWLPSSPLPLPLACHSAVSLQGELYVLGGWTPQNQPDDEPDKLSNRVFHLDPGTDRWTERASMRFSRYRCGTAVLNGEIFIIGGIGCEGEDRGQSRRCLSSVEIYNPDTDCWRSGPPLPTALLSLHTCTSNLGALAGRLYLCGYFKEPGRHEIITKEILELDPADGVWTVVDRRAAMNDNYDVCLVAKIHPGGLLTA